jgi:archaellum component FlaC
MASTDDINNATKALKILQEQFAATEGSLPNFLTTIENLAGKIGEDVGDIGDEFKQLNDYIIKTRDSLTVMGAGNGIKNLQDPLDKLTRSFITFSTMVDKSKVFEQFSDASMPAIDLVTTHLDKLQATMEALHIPGAEKLTKVAESLIANANEGEKLENSFVALSAAGGDLSQVFDGQGGQLKDLTALTTAYSNVIGEAADATGLEIHQAMAFGNELKKIPEFMDQNVKTGIEGTDSTNALTAAMKLMSGTGQSQAEVIKTLNFAYDKLSNTQGKVNESAQKGAQFLSTISSVSTGLKLRFDDVRNVMESVADQFQFVGDETDAAARVLGRYTDALRETGLTSKASLEITEKLTKGISELSIGQKAFMSLRSGGPGGLQGAFQIEQLLRQGKMDQVVMMAERNIKQQFGGRIYTQAEAAESPQAAAQFMRQRQLLTSGVFGVGGGMKDDQATRFLEALKKGDTLSATKEIKTGQDALTSVTKQADQVQQRNNTELKSISRASERIAIATEISALAEVKRSFGTTGEGQRAQRMRDEMSRAGSRGAIEQQNEFANIANGTGGMNQKAVDEQLGILGRKFMAGFAESGESITAGAADFAANMATSAGSGIAAARDLHQKIKADTEKVSAPGIQNPHEAVALASRSAAMNAANAGIAQHAVPAGAPGHVADKKVVIEIVGPPGFHVQQKSTPDPGVILNILNKASTVSGQ